VDGFILLRITEHSGIEKNNQDMQRYIYREGKSTGLILPSLHHPQLVELLYGPYGLHKNARSADLGL
jgi:hypothetical protein